MTSSRRPPAQPHRTPKPDLTTRASRAERVIERVRAIPKGYVRTYGDIDERAPRLVGRILATNHDLPWHRVVRADGTIPRESRNENCYSRKVSQCAATASTSTRRGSPWSSSRGAHIAPSHISPPTPTKQGGRMPIDLPDVILRYFERDADRDIDSIVNLFADDATVIDEGEERHGTAGIRAWQTGAASKNTYTTEITSAEALAPDRYLVTGRLTGNFPGGTADLKWDFTIAGQHIARLIIAP